MTRHIRALAFVCAIVGTAAAAAAQGAPAAAGAAADDPIANARFHVGVFHFTPGIAISNVGVDSNVFNSAANPQQDKTVAVGPILNLYMRMRRARLSGTVGGQYLYYRKFVNQRAWNTADSLRFEVPLTRIRPFLTGSYTRTRDRSGFEIDSRLRQNLTTWTGGSAIRVGSRTTLTFDGGQQFTKFDSDQIYRSVNISDALNHRTDQQRVQLGRALTPLTTWVTTIETMQDRFEVDRSRNADSVRVMTGFDLKPAALIAGRVMVGYRHFNVLRSTAPDYNGPVASATATMILGRYRVSVVEQRDTVYSFDIRFPFSVQTTTGVEVTRRIGRAWDVVGRTALNVMTYRSALASVTDRPVDRVTQYGGGIGYTVGRTMRIGLNADSLARSAESTLASNYSGFRVGLSLSYGLSQ